RPVAVVGPACRNVRSSDVNAIPDVGGSSSPLDPVFALFKGAAPDDPTATRHLFDDVLQHGIAPVPALRTLADRRR
ncbi:MAG TPA: hypothetical protein VFQ88_10685, partial [Nevskiaceae bacterium]|nr:hypothetical protein [Nevskiaceae bacterium]